MSLSRRRPSNAGRYPLRQRQPRPRHRPCFLDIIQITRPPKLSQLPTAPTRLPQLCMLLEARHPYARASFAEPPTAPASEPIRTSARHYLVHLPVHPPPTKAASWAVTLSSARVQLLFLSLPSPPAPFASSPAAQSLRREHKPERSQIDRGRFRELAATTLPAQDV
jgi:hypothetical protein